MVHIISHTFDGLIETDNSLASSIGRWRCELKMAECSNSSHDHGSSKHVIETVRDIDPALNETGDIEKALNWMRCTSDLDNARAIFDLIFAGNIERFIPNIVEACARCKISRRMVLERMYEDLPHILRVTSLENWMPLFERISSEFEFKMVM